LLRKQDFKDDKVDAGDIGAGHSVTALYEIAFVNSIGRSIEPLRYSREKPMNNDSREIAFVRMRYKEPTAETSKELQHPVYRTDVQNNINHMGNNFRFATAVAAFGQLLRNDSHIHAMNYEQVHQLAKNALGNDVRGYRKEFLDLVDTASSLVTE